MQIKKKRISLDEIRNGCVTTTNGDGTEAKICMIQEEFRQGIDGIKHYPRAATIYGSARLPETSPYYEKARRIAYRISKELGIAVITGGGGSIMEAGNRGAYEAGGKSVGLTIKLPHEQATNKYVTDEIPFFYFFARKVSMSYTAEVCLFFPGGYGTMDELFNILTLVQTKKIPALPIILVGSDFWKDVDIFIKNTLRDKFQTIDPLDTSLYTILDDEDAILNIVKHAPKRSEDGY